MGKICVAGKCSNSSKDGVSLHRFPKLEPYRTLWTRAIQNTRKNWLRPTNNSFLCSAHFIDDSFLEFIGKRFQDFGLSPHKLRRLKPHAVPTLFGASVSSRVVTTSDIGACSSTSTSAVTLVQPGPSLSNTNVIPRPRTVLWEEAVKKRKVGGAFKKREHARTLIDALEERVFVHQHAPPQVGPPPTVRDLLKRKSSTDISFQDSKNYITEVQEISSNAPFQDESAGTDDEPETPTLSTPQGTQTDRQDGVDISVQCDMVPLPTLELRPRGENAPAVSQEETWTIICPCPTTEP